MSAEFDALTAQVAATVGVEASAVTLIQALAGKVTALAAQVADAPTKQQLTDLAGQLNSSATALGAAVAANPV